MLKEVLWIISNISVGTPEQIDHCLIKNNRLKILMHYCNHDNYEIKKEAIYSIANPCKNASPEQIKFFVEMGLLKMIYEVLSNETQAVEIIMVLLEATYWVLGKAIYDIQNETNPFIDIVFELGLVEIFENLQRHKDNKVYQLSLKIIEAYFDMEELLG